MSVSKSTVGAQLHKALKERIHNRLEVLAERKNELSFTSGETLSRQDCHQLQVTLNDPASKRLWTASQKEDGVENCLYNLDEWLQNAQEKTQFMNDVPRYFFQGKMTVSAASIRSSVYHRIVFNCIDGGLFHNEDFSIDGCGFEFDHLK